MFLTTHESRHVPSLLIAPRVERSLLVNATLEMAPMKGP